VPLLSGERPKQSYRPEWCVVYHSYRVNKAVALVDVFMCVNVSVCGEPGSK